MSWSSVVFGVDTYREAATQLLAFLEANGMPTNVAAIRRRHFEAFVVNLMESKCAVGRVVGPSTSPSSVVIVDEHGTPAHVSTCEVRAARAGTRRSGWARLPVVTG